MADDQGAMVTGRTERHTMKFPFLQIALAFTLIVSAISSMASISAQAAQSDVPFTVESVAEGLDHPWSIAFLPGGDMLVTERAGRVRVIRDGQLLDAPIANTPDGYVEGQGGYFDILPDPAFATNRLVYLSFAHGDANANTTRIVRAQLIDNAFVNREVIFDTAPEKSTPVHYGGRLAFLPDATLLMTTGDGFDFREQAQRLETTLGKTIRINTDGSIPQDNPFVNQSGANAAVWTYGHRSPQGLAIDPATGTVWQNEHGPLGGDETNILRAGKNYGWPIATRGIDYSGARISPFTTYPGMEDPVHFWTPSIAVSSLAVYRGSAFAEWDGDLLAGALAGRALHRLTVENGKIVGEQKLLTDLDARIRDVRIGPDGLIYITTDDGAGKVIRLIPN